mgnify:CR=1 FL=1
MLYLSRDCTMRSGCQGFLDNQFRKKFFLLENVVYMQTHILFRCLEQLHHLCLRKPNGIVSSQKPS